MFLEIYKVCQTQYRKLCNKHDKPNPRLTKQNFQDPSSQSLHFRSADMLRTSREHHTWKNTGARELVYLTNENRMSESPCPAPKTRRIHFWVGDLQYGSLGLFVDPVNDFIVVNSATTKSTRKYTKRLGLHNLYRAEKIRQVQIGERPYTVDYIQDIFQAMWRDVVNGPEVDRRSFLALKHFRNLKQLRVMVRDVEGYENDRRRQCENLVTNITKWYDYYAQHQTKFEWFNPPEFIKVVVHNSYQNRATEAWTFAPTTHFADNEWVLVDHLPDPVRFR